MRYNIIRVLLLAILAASAAGGHTSVTETKHNLSITGPGAIRATSETQVCVFCHTPHSASVQAPMWNRPEGGKTYQLYWSTTVDAYLSPAAAPQPNGASKLCLSCHDGTIALGSTVASGTIEMLGGVTTLPPSSPAHLGQDLSGDHPVSFRVTSDAISANNAKGDVPLRTVSEMREGSVARLDSSDRLQCTSCHDPHDDSYGDFLLTANVGELCLDCHS